MNERRIGSHDLAPVGFGCMNLNHAYGRPLPRADAIALLRRAADSGVEHFDTAALYGFGSNEDIVGEALQPIRAKVFLASKCGMTGVDGRRVIDGRPATIKTTCERSLRSLRTDVIDLYYLHRCDKNVPLEDSLGALRDLVQAGHIRHVGVSEVSAATLHRAHAAHPIAAVQNEYSLWSRNAEIGVLEAARAIGAAFVAFSPLGRGFLTDRDVEPSGLDKDDLRRGMPRFQPAHHAANQALLEPLRDLARRSGCTTAQLALAWLLQHPHVLPIPGATSIAHLTENVGAGQLALSADVLAAAAAIVNQHTVSGARYPEATLREIDTEEFSTWPA